MLKFKNFFLKYWLFILLAIIGTFLMSFYLLNKYLSPEKSQILLKLPAPFLINYETKNPISYSTLESNFPQLEKEATVFEVKDKIFDNQEAVSIAESFGFKENPIIQQDQSSNDIFYQWENNEFGSLLINLTKGEIEYSGIEKQLIPNPNENLPTLNESENFIWQFIKEKGFSPPTQGINLELTETQYYKDQETTLQKVDSPEEGDFIGALFKYKINNKEIKGLVISFLLGQNFNVLKFNYVSPFMEIKTLGSYPLKDKKEVIGKLKNIKTINELNIIGGHTVIKDDAQNISNISLDKIELVYLKTKLPQTYLQPVFLISGRVILEGEIQTKVGIYLPAIKDQYLLGY